MNNKLILILTLICFITLSFKSEDKEPFLGYTELTGCMENIPFYYATKKMPAFLEATEKLRDVQIVLVTVNKKNKPTYSYYYLQKYDSKYGKSAHLVPADEYNKDTALKTILFLEYKEKKHFFYRADCFNEKLAQNPALANILIKE